MTLPFAAPETPEVVWFTEPVALPAVFTVPAMPLVAALAAPLAAPLTCPLDDDTAEEAAPCAASRVDAARSRAPFAVE